MYDHVPNSVLENEDCKMLWDFSVRTDHEIEAKRPDLLEQLPNYRCGSARRWKGESKRQRKSREIQKMWGVRTKMIPIVVQALGTIPLRLKENLRTIGVDTSIELIHRSALLGMPRILRKVRKM